MLIRLVCETVDVILYYVYSSTSDTVFDFVVVVCLDDSFYVGQKMVDWNML